MFSRRWCLSASFCFLLFEILGLPRSLYGFVTSAMENTLYSQGCGHPVNDLVTSVLGHHPYGGMWWAMYGSLGLCVLSATFRQTEATSSDTLSQEFNLFLPGSTMSGGGWVGWEKRVPTFMTLFFPVGSTSISTDHLGWKVVSVLS